MNTKPGVGMLSITKSKIDTARPFINASIEYLASLYPDEPTGMIRQDATMYLAYRDGIAIGCAGYVLEDTTAELVHVWVDPSARKAGVGKALVQRIESQLQGKLIKLESGVKQIPALKLYCAMGYKYVVEVGTSIFMEKQI